MASDSLDTELLELINRLNKVQSKIGNGKHGLKGEALDTGKIDGFLDLKAAMLERLETLRETEEKARNATGSNPRELMALQSQIRGDLSKLTDDWKQLDFLFRSETKKRKSKLSPAELKSRQDALVALFEEIEAIKDAQRAGFVKGYKGGSQLVKMEDSELFRPKTPGEEYKYNPAEAISRSRQNMTDQHRQALLLIRDRDKKIDEEIDLIGRSVDELGEIAKAANEEVTLQNVMLDEMEEKMEEVHDKILNVNESMKKTLDETRTGDKFCIDIFCLIILIGMIVVLVKLTNS